MVEEAAPRVQNEWGNSVFSAFFWKMIVSLSKIEIWLHILYQIEANTFHFHVLWLKSDFAWAMMLLKTDILGILGQNLHCLYKVNTELIFLNSLGKMSTVWSKLATCQHFCSQLKLSYSDLLSYDWRISRLSWKHNKMLYTVAHKNIFHIFWPKQELSFSVNTWL